MKICKQYGTSTQINRLTKQVTVSPIVVCGRDMQDNMKLEVAQNADDVTCEGCIRGMRELIRTGGN